MYYCDICGRPMNKKIKLAGHTLCSKHKRQYLKYGTFIDTTQRTNNDPNDYNIDWVNKTVVFNLYNQNNVKTGEFTVDLEDIEKVKYHKWRFTHNHVVTGQPAKKQQRELSHIILDIPKKDDSTVLVDHIDGNGTNNCKDNLRICTQGENLLNKSSISTNTSGFIGVSYNAKRNRYEPEIRRDYSRCHLGRYRTLKEAVYARFVAEQLVFGSFANKTEQNKNAEFAMDLEENRKKEIEQFVRNKLATKDSFKIQ